MPGKVLLRWRNHLPGVFVLVLISLAGMFAIYLQTLSFPFHSDDHVYLSGNLALQQLQPGELWRLLIEPYNRYEYLPLRDLSYWIELQLFGLHPAGYRIDNLILYLLCCALVYAVTLSVWRYLNPGQADSARWAAAVVTALFTIHPAHIEAVVWISGRKDLLAGMFSMLALWLALRARAELGLRGGYATGTLIALVAALLSKGSAVAMAPVIALLWLMCWRDTALSGGGQTLWRRFGPLLWIMAPVLISVGAFLIFAAHSQVRATPYWGMETVTRAFAILGWLARLSVSPESRHLFYPVFECGSFYAMVATGIAVLVIAAAGGIMLLRRNTLAGFASVVFLLLCAPFLQLIPYDTFSPVADRFVFIALWPILLLLTALLWRLNTVPCIGLLCVIALCWMGQTADRAGGWRSDDALIGKDMQAYPGYYMPVFQKIIGDGAPDEVLSQDAIRRLAERIDNADARSLVITLAAAQHAVAMDTAAGSSQEAMAGLWEAAAVIKNRPEQLKWNPALQFIWSAGSKELVRLWQNLAEKFPAHIAVRYNQGMWLLDDGWVELAARPLRIAAESQQLERSLRGPAYMGLGVALLYSGHADDAVAPLQAALRQFPAELRADCLLAEVYRRKARNAEARAAASGCARLADVQAAIGLYQAGHYAAALAKFESPARDGNATAQLFLGLIYDNGMGVAQNYRQAAAWYYKAAEQGMADAQYNLAMLYSNGLGVPVDWVETRKWLGVAAVSGNKNAAEIIAEVEANMSPGQIRQARVAAADWLERHQ